ncbi:hypothetical protein LHYA1_G003798 [Lachnellula hyalina]|uniref:Serine/threonine-protein kinase ppk6 n=1 Tax=Lachnellula hyalina TaxID=1316788 RepID=A0A8H8U0Y1_9HELO|nr:uncharacterized protein LHYA1_G003798 [Lachnellula hyalina]TVY27805.1 hypothetical protein LHYA1_G003798 [Lachnellula hyalina]
MSSDLLAEFDSFYNPSSKPNAPANSTPASHDLSFLSHTNLQSQNGQQSQSQSAQPSGDIWGGMTSFQSNANSTQANAARDDIWGSFEAAIEPVKPYTQSFAPSASNYGAFTTANKGQQNPGIVRRPTLDLFSNNDHHDSFNSIPGPKAQPQPPMQAAPPIFSPGDVLFDATEELEDEDDFGDFETVTSPEPPPPKPQVPVQTQPPQPSQSLDLMFGATTLEPKPTKRPNNLLPSNLNSGGLPYPQAPKSPSFQERNPFGSLGLSMNPVTAVKKEEKPKTASPITAWPSFAPPAPEIYRDSPVLDNQPDDDWGDFADLPPETPAKPTAKPASGIEADAWAWDAADQVTPPEIPTTTSTAPPPPSNIPPPSVLLTLFPPLFDLPRTTLFTTLSTQPFPLKNRILSDPSTLTFLRAYLLLATVAAHIIAGRKQRWKRDTLLSQAMKIGPSGGKGGMKLAGVDKAEVVREEREAADVVRMWREQIGRLRSAVAVANSSMRDGGPHLDIPEISENMAVRVQERGMTAPKQCVVCGLKREERVAKVDVGVEDSFGEWWVEHWGHRACRNFWLEHEAKLRHR